MFELLWAFSAYRVIYDEITLLRKFIIVRDSLKLSKTYNDIDGDTNLQKTYIPIRNDMINV